MSILERKHIYNTVRFVDIVTKYLSEKRQFNFHFMVDLTLRSQHKTTDSNNMLKVQSHDKLHLIVG